MKLSGSRYLMIPAVLLLTMIHTHLTHAEEIYHPSRLDPVIADSIAKFSTNLFEGVDALSNSWQHEKALQRLMLSSSISAELLWRQSRSKIDLGENLEGDTALHLFEQAMSHAERAVELDSTNAMAHQMLATAAGRVALFKGVFKASGLVKRVHHHALLAVAHGDSVPIAHYVLGRTHKKLMAKSGLARKLAGLSWASNDSVRYYFERAIDISKGNMIQCYVEYADFLIEKEEEVDRSRDMLEKALALPLRDEHDQEAKVKAQELLAILDE
ncbi:hypothetical protein K8I28_05020 [bacterium]|nr:hypothetical protein [bacterium]